MTKINLTGGDYQSRDIIASSQRCVNLYLEAIDSKQAEPNASIYLPSPGLTVLVNTPQGPIRCLYTASNGDFFICGGRSIYHCSDTWVFTLVGSFLLNSNKTVVMTDNGVDVLVCDGTPIVGFTFDLESREGWKQIQDPGWYGSTYVDYSDTFFIANYIGTPTFYISGSADITFDALDFAGKSAKNDPLVAAVVTRRVVWLIGEQSTECWYNSGGGGLGQTSGTTSFQTNTFPFELQAGGTRDEGCAAPYSIAKIDDTIIWLAQTSHGAVFLTLGTGYQTSRITTYAIEQVWSTYSRVDDAIAYCSLEQGHIWYTITFPEADASWRYDIAAKTWHQKVWVDDDGVEHKHRGLYYAYAYGRNILSDWEFNVLFESDVNAYTDYGRPIKRLRSFPQQIDQKRHERDVEANVNNRLVYKSFIADVDVGQVLDPNDDPQISLRWSDTKGASWGNAVMQPLGKSGAYDTNVIWHRLGYARNRVFELSWSCNAKTALAGCYIDVVKAGS